MNIDNTDFSTIIGFLAAFGIVIGAIFLAIYLVDAIARYKYLKIRGYENAWLAFIPIANIYSCVEATYGTAPTINVFGLQLPSVIVKLYTLVFGVIAGVVANIPYAGSPISLLISIASIALAVMILKDMLFLLDKQISTGVAIVACIIPLVEPIMILIACNGKTDNQYDYKTDERQLPSQTDANGPLSQFNKQNTATK